MARVQNALMEPHLQGEEGIKGEKGMRGLWGRVVILMLRITMFIKSEYPCPC